MRTALYYPHTRIKNERLLKTALLLWDHLEYIVPDNTHGVQYANNAMQEAIELIGKPRLPSEENKQELHELVEDLVTQKLPEPFYYRGDGTDPHLYELYPQKLLPDTWRALQETGFASPHAAHDRLSRQPLPQVTGLWLMSLLADCCAGATRARVTDRGDAYTWIHSLLAQEPLGQEEGSYDFVVPVTLKFINASEIPLTKLIEFRKREQKEANGHQLRGLRHSYLTLIENHINDLRSKEKPTDREEAQRCFESDAQDQLKDLREELGVAQKDFWLSQVVVATVASVVTAGVTWLSGSSIPIPDAATATGGAVLLGAGILRENSKLAARRKAIMQQNPTAYLYELQQSAA